MKGIHLTLDSWSPHWEPERCRQDPYGLDIDISEDNLGGEAEEYLGQINGTPRKGDAAEKGEPKTVIAAQRCFSDLQVLNQLTKDKYNLLQPVCTTQI